MGRLRRESTREEERVDKVRVREKQRRTDRSKMEKGCLGEMNQKKAGKSFRTISSCYLVLSLCLSVGVCVCVDSICCFMLISPAAGSFS